ncbi:hypothetical protein ACJX0J_018073, partial [Zea mays]
HISEKRHYTPNRPEIFYSIQIGITIFRQYYVLETQVQLVLACCIFHNWILDHGQDEAIRGRGVLPFLHTNLASESHSLPIWSHFFIIKDENVQNYCVLNFLKSHIVLEMNEKHVSIASPYLIVLYLRCCLYMFYFFIERGIPSTIITLESVFYAFISAKNKIKQDNNQIKKCLRTAKCLNKRRKNTREKCL